jgi:hypothetical protein
MVIFLHGRNEVDLRQPLISTSPASFIDLIRIPSMAHSSPLLMSEIRLTLLLLFLWPRSFNRKSDSRPS